MSRGIKLTRLHAINWYGYNDSLPVEGNVLLAGITGSGKSVLMDLIMTVLVGTDVAHKHFNRSATGAQSDRTLKSYCLLDTKREENGVTQYQRHKGAITYAALEFTWPSKAGDEPRVETWGLRIEFHNPAQTQGQIKAFFCGVALTRDNFVAISPEDGKKHPLEVAAFRHLIEQQFGGRFFETQEQFLRDMANEQHLNFNRGVLASLLPQAMAFTNRKSFDSFIRDFVLPGDQLNVSDVVASYKSFLAHERDLHDLHDQLNRLQTIRDLHQSHKAAKRDQVVARWLSAELKHRHTAGIVTETVTNLARENAELAKEANRITALENQIADRKSEIEQLRNLIRTSPEGGLYLYIKEQNRNLLVQIENLRAVGTRMEDALRNRVRMARQWLSEVHATRLKDQVDTSLLEAAIKQLGECDTEANETALNVVAEAAEQIQTSLSRAVRPLRERLEELRKSRAKLREEIGALELGHLPFPTTLLQSLLEALPQESREPSAQPLSKMCEITDERWRAATEVAFGHKFAVLVDKANQKEARNIYHELKGDSPYESLIDSETALRLVRAVQPGSLAEKIRTEHPIAKAIVSILFGDLICVGDPGDFEKYDFAILPDGLMKHGAFIERPRHYDNLPFIGRRGLEQQLAIKKSQLKDLEAEENTLTPIVAAVQSTLERASRLIPEHASLSRDLHNAQRLPVLRKDLDANVAKLNAINSASFDEKDQRADKLGEDLPKWEKDLRELLGSERQVKVRHLEADLVTARTTESEMLRAFERVQAESGDISNYASRLDEWRSEVVATYHSFDVSANEFARLEREADKKVEVDWAKLVAERKLFAAAHHKFDELDAENSSNAPWDGLWHQIAEANIPDYELKAKTERSRWEYLFRNNVLQKLDRALRRLRDDVALLNGHLKTPIGNDVYEIHVKVNPDFKQLRDLVDLNALHQRDELFYEAVDGQMRDTLDRFLHTLVEKPDSVEAAYLLDYRRYHDYDLVVRDNRDRLAKPISVDKQSGKMSGGENQSPYFVVILASYLRAYKRHEARFKDPSLSLVPIDEAFSKMDTGRIKDCIEAIKALDLQGIFSMSTGNVPGAFGLCDQLIIVSRNDDRRDGRAHVRNIPVSILRHSEEGSEWMQEHS